MLHVSAHGFDQIRDQVVAPLELYIDLRPGGLDAGAQRDQPVERGDDP